MDTNGRGMTPEAREALIKQMKSAEEQNSGTVQSQPQQATQSNVSATASMRERMLNSQANNSKAVVLEQGANYAPNAQSTPQQNNGASTTIINTTQVPQDNSGDTVERGFKPNKTFVLIAAGIVVFGIILLAVFYGKGSDKPTDDTEVAGEIIPDDELEWITPDSNYLYTPDQIEQLRLVGYTGTEIETFQSQQVDADEMIKEATARRDAWVQEAIAPLYDSTSQEYKDYIAQTWLTLPKRNDTNEWNNIAGYYEVRKNLDYEKVTSYGNQLFLKVFLDDNVHEDWFFLNVTPEDWNKLKERGNVIVNYTYCTRYVGSDSLTQFEDFENIFITAAYLEIIE